MNNMSLKFKEIENKYLDFFNVIKVKKELSYKINEDSSIDIFNNETGYIHLEDGISCIPPNTTFHTGVIINCDSLKTIGENVIVKGLLGDFHIRNCDKLKSIGEKLQCSGVLNISECKSLKELPDNIKARNIKLENTSIQKFGKNIKARSLIIDKENYNSDFIKNIEDLALDIENIKITIDYNIRLKNLNNKLKKFKKAYFFQLMCGKDRKRIHDFFLSKQKLLSEEKIENSKIRIPKEIFLNPIANNELLEIIKNLASFNIYHNYLDLKSPNLFCSKLINEEYDLITEKDIQKCSLSLFNNKRILINDGIYIDMIDYCMDLKGIEYLKKIGYKITSEVLNVILIKEAKNKYPDFFYCLETKNEQIEYKLNQDGFIDIFHNDETKNFIYLNSTKRNISVPPNVRFHKNVNMWKSSLERIGENVIVNGNFYIINCSKLESIGEKLQCSNVLHISACENFKKIPDHTKSRIIFLENQDIQEFGKNIEANTLRIKKDYDITSLCIKNMENLNINNLMINDVRLNNINKIKNLKRIGFLQKILDETSQNEIDDSVFILDNETTEEFLKTVKKLYINMYRNYLDFKSPNSLCSKLINEEYNLITENDIQECILSNNNREVLISENKIPINIIDYCVGQKGISYLKKLGYEFTEKELDTITETQIKSSYEKELIEQRVLEKNIKKSSKLNKKPFNVL